METILTVAEAAGAFPELIHRIECHGDTAALTRNGSIVARITPERARKGLTGKAFGELWSKRPKLTADEARELERFVEEGRGQMNRPEVLSDPWEKWG